MKRASKFDYSIYTQEDDQIYLGVPCDH